MNEEELVIDFNNPSNFIYDPLKIEVGSDARLKLSANPGLSFNQAFDSDNGFTYDSTKAKFNAGQIEQIDQRPINSITGATYTNSFDLSFSADGFVDKSAIVNGTPTLVGGKLVCSGSQGVRYQDSLIGDLSGNWVAKFRYTPNYTNGPATNVNIVAISQLTGGVDDIVIFHSPSGDSLRITANGLAAVTFGIWQPTSGQEYVFEVFCINNIVSIFVGDTEIGTGKTINPAQGTESTLIHLGAYSTTYNSADGSFRDFILYSTASQTSTYIVPEAEFLENNIILPEFLYSGTGDLDSFNAFSATELNTPKYILNDMYFNGSAWVSSDGTPSQANTQIEVNNNISALVAFNSIVPQIVFENSSLKQSVSILTIEYSGQIYPMTNPTIEYDMDVFADALISITEISTNPGQDQTKAIIKVNNTWVWYNTTTSEWETSDETYSQSNTIAEINTYAPGLFTERRRLRIRIFLHSDDGSTTPILEQLTVFYSFAGSTPEGIETCAVYWYSINPDGSVCNCLFRAVLSEKSVKYKNQNLVCDKDITNQPDSEDGYTELNLIPNSEMTSESGSITYTIEKGEIAAIGTIWDSDNPIAVISVPNNNSAILWDIKV